MHGTETVIIRYATREVASIVSSSNCVLKEQTHKIKFFVWSIQLCFLHVTDGFSSQLSPPTDVNGPVRYRTSLFM
jgi:hypothetical protein